jgi:hypothetical protein
MEITTGLFMAVSNQEERGSKAIPVLVGARWLASSATRATLARARDQRNEIRGVLKFALRVTAGKDIE